MKAKVFFHHASRLTLAISLACSMALATYAGSDHKREAASANDGLAAVFGALCLYLLAATPWNLPPIDTYDILRSRIYHMPPGLIEYQLRMFARHSRIHQDDIIV